MTIRRHPHAAVLLAFDAEDLETPTVYDFEWFDGLDAMNEFVQEVNAWAEQDIQQYGDANHVTVEVLDTKSDPISIGTVHVRNRVGDEDWADRVFKKITEDPSFILLKSVTAPSTATDKPKKKAKPVVKRVRQKTKAAAVAQGEEVAPGDLIAALQAKVDEVKKPKAEKAGRRVVKPKSKADREALRQRIAEREAAKRAPATAEPDAAHRFVGKLVTV